MLTVELVDCKKRLFDDDDDHSGADVEKAESAAEPRERNSVKKQKIICT